MDMTTEYQITLTERFHGLYDKETHDRVLGVKAERSLEDGAAYLIHRTRWEELNTSLSWPGGLLSGKEDHHLDGVSKLSALVVRKDGRPLTEKEQETLKDALWHGDERQERIL